MTEQHDCNGTVPIVHKLEDEYDILIVGAGLGGINCAYRFQVDLPGCRYAVLEARADMGGTWDLFKYPGIRSDSDLHTFGFAFHPWAKGNAIAEGASIVEYINETVTKFDLKKNIYLKTSVEKANWSSKDKRWSVEITQKDGTTKICRSGFLLMASGYYDYKEPLPVDIPGLQDFKGTVIHPQFWPTDLDYSDKNIVIIGSGATAITLLPNLAKKAKHVTMLQRSPTYVLSLPQIDIVDRTAAKLLPRWLSFRFTRLKFLVIPLLFYNFCCRFPNVARKVLAWRTKQNLPPNVKFDPHFKPKYNPWAQRLCVAPDGDFYQCLHTGRCEIVTGHINTVQEDGVLLKSGEKINADILVTATGLKMQLGGHVAITVDGEKVQLSDKYLWRSAMIEDTPNLAFVLGYVNASWTLGADVTAALCIRILKHMKAKGFMSCAPHLPTGKPLCSRPVFNLSSTYVNKALEDFPNAGDSGPWKGRTDYFSDMYDAMHGDLTSTLKFSS